MASLLQKFGTLVRSNLHNLLDAVIDLNSVAAIKDHVRQLQSERDKLADAVAGAQADLTMLRQQASALEAKIEATNGNIDLLLNDDDPSNDRFAEPLEKELMGYESQLQDLQSQLTEDGEVFGKLEEMLRRVNGKVAEETARISQLEAIERRTKAQSGAAATLKQFASVVGDTPDIDNVESRLRRQGAVASAQLERALGDAGVPGGDVQDAQVAARLAARRAKRSQESAK